MVLKLGFSTCPNDTFIFDAIVNKKIDTKGLDFDVMLADVEELNNAALNNELDITKLSFHAYAYVANYYSILTTGSALGDNNGPLLVSKKKIYPDEIENLHIAIPGKYTTANLLLNIAYPKVNKKSEYLFSDIEEAVLSNETDAGLIIHENRFTYKEKGLKKIIDLGEFWQNKTDSPIPLGGIVIKRDIPIEIQRTFNSLLKESIQFAYLNPNSSLQYMKKHAQNMNEDIMKQHVDLYVNNYTLELGKKGKNAIEQLLEYLPECILAQIVHGYFVE